jgi:ubiquinone/menaquinone biosynthesis C-methylase UbiE
MHGKARSGYLSATFADIPHEERFKAVINTYSLFNGVLEFASKNKVKHFVISLLWLEKAD